MVSRLKFIQRRLARGAAVGLALSTASLLAVHPAEASARTRPLTEAVTVDGASRCLEATSVGALVARWLGSNAIDARVSIVVSARDRPSRALSFEVRRDGEVIAVRRFDPPPVTCADVRRVVAIAIALAIESTVLAAPSTEPPATSAPVGPAPHFVLRPSWGVDGAVLAGVLPGVAFGLESHVDVDLSARFALTAGILTTFPSETPVGSGRADLTLVAAEAAACWIALHSRVDLRACGGVAAGGVRVEGEAFAPSLSPLLPWVSMMGHVGIRLAILKWLAIEGRLDGLLPVVRPNLEVASPNGAILFSRSFPVGGGVGALGWVLTFR
jgi:hypothetical protein